MSPQYFVTCSCGQQMRVGEEHFGKTGKCVKCRKPITITRDSVTPIDAAPAARATRPAAGDGVPAEWNPGDVILDLYEVKGELGRGGMGKVYRVHHKGWNVDLAVKSPLPDSFQTQAQKDNFVRECETWVNLGLHPNTVSCYYVRTLGGIPRVFAEYVEGGTLEQWITSGKLYEDGKEKAIERIFDIAIQFAWGLHYAHEQGLIHQDVKPANVMMTPDGIVKVTDFGLVNARAVAGEDVSAQPGSRSIMASYGGMTPAYCSPEQADNAARHQAGIPREQLIKLTRQTDIYSWAVSVFEMFNGGVSWLGGNVVGESLKQYVETGPSEEHLPSMPEPVAQLLTQCLKKDTTARPKDFLQIADALTTEYRNATRADYPRETPKPAEALADSLNNRGVSLLDLGRDDEAEKRFDEALQADPQHIEATYNRGLYKWRSGHMTDDALVRQLHELGKTHAGDWQVKYFLGQVHIERGDAESAVDVLAQALTGSGGVDETKRALEEARGGKGRWRSCLRTFEGHTSTVSSVSISPDGRWALSGSDDKTLRLWELSTGRCLRTFEGHTKQVDSVGISRDGRWALSGSRDKTLRLWELSTGRCLRIFEGHTDVVLAVSISPDGRWGMSGSGDKTLRLWELSTSQCLRTFEGHGGSIDSVGSSPDGRWVLSGSYDNTLRLWDVVTGQCTKTFEGHTRPVKSVCVSPDGHWGLSGSHDNTMRLWELPTGRCLRIFDGHDSWVNSVSISPDGHFGLSGSSDKTLRLWELATGRCLRTFEVRTESVHSVSISRSIHSVSISPDGRWGLSGSDDNTQRLWELHLAGAPAHFAVARPRGAEEIWVQHRAKQQAEQNAMSALERGLASEAAAELRKARRLPGYERDPALLELWRQAGLRGRRTGLSGGWLVRTFEGHAGSVESVSISPDGCMGLSGSQDKTLRLWELSTGRCVRAFEGHTDTVSSVSISPDGRWGLSGSENFAGKVENNTVWLWELSTGRCVRTFEKHNDTVSSVSISPDGRWGLSGSEDKALRLWELSTGRCLRIFEGHTDVVLAVSISPDGRWGMSGSGDKTLRLWELSTGRCVRIFEGHTEWVSCVSISLDGRWALSGSDDRTLRLWDLSTGRCLRTFEGCARGVGSVSMSLDGRWGLSGSYDKTLRLWELSSGRCLRTFEGHTHIVESVSISPDGRWALSGSADNTLRLWELAWDYEFPDPVDWDEGARPYLINFLTLHTPHAATLPADGQPTDGLSTLALTRGGKPTWTDEDFKQLLNTLANTGYGWLCPEGVKKVLQKMAATWDGPPPLA